MKNLGLGELVISRFDAISYIISKTEFQKNSPFEKVTMEKLQRCFKKLVPWSKDVKQVFTRRFEIIGIPIHLWSDETIKQIGGRVGKV